jgi:hypothetical protein
MIALALIALLLGFAWVLRSLLTVKFPPTDWERDDWQ